MRDGMRRQMVIGLLGLSMGLIVAQTESAAKRQKQAPPDAQQAPAEKPASKASLASPELAEREKALQTWRANLTGTRWDLELVLSGPGQPPVVQSDLLTFGQRTVGSEGLLKMGYPDSNSYTLYAPTEESVSWEAMQVKEDSEAQEMVIWRGEIVGDTMQGTLTKQRTDPKKGLLSEQLPFTGRPVVVSTPAAEAQPETASPATHDQGSPEAPQEAKLQ